MIELFTWQSCGPVPDCVCGVPAGEGAAAPAGSANGQFKSTFEKCAIGTRHSALPTPNPSDGSCCSSACVMPSAASCAAVAAFPVPVTSTVTDPPARSLRIVSTTPLVDGIQAPCTEL